MDLYDGFLTYWNQVLSGRIEDLRKSQRTVRKFALRARQRTHARVEALETQVEVLTAVLGALVERLDERGVVTQADLRAALNQRPPTSARP